MWFRCQEQMPESAVPMAEPVCSRAPQGFQPSRLHSPCQDLRPASLPPPGLVRIGQQGGLVVGRPRIGVSPVENAQILPGAPGHAG